MSKTATNGKAAPVAAMEIEQWPIGSLVPYENNARRIPQRAIDTVVKSIKTYGWRQPIVVDGDGVVIVGHTRLLAAKKMRLKSVPVHVAAGLTADQVKAYRLADNRSHEESAWDFERLQAELTSLSESEYDLDLTGFDVDQRNQLLTGVAEPDLSATPDFLNEDLSSWKSVKVHFKDAAAWEAFKLLVNQPRLTEKSHSMWYPEEERVSMKTAMVVSTEKIAMRYPVYIPSKGRADSRLTAKALDKLGIEYHIVVEPQEYDAYAAVIAPAKILTLPFSNLGQGSIPARNWIWDHAVSRGYTRHWIMDDNIHWFARLANNLKVHVTDNAIFRVMEDVADSYENIALLGPQYEMFVPRKETVIPYIKNTRIYSCILINHKLEHRWRGRYNEDTDLSLRALKDGWCTLLFNQYLAKKNTTMRMKGGNTDELYKDDGRLKMAQSLQEQHPDCVVIKQKWGRWQHSVDYSRWRNNRFIGNPYFTPSTDDPEYGMKIVEVKQCDEEAAA